MSAMTRFTAAGLSDMGRVRQNNEDRYLIDPELGVFIVVDGVGGHAAGEEAAAIAVETISTRLRRQVGSVESRIREAITLANNEIFERARANEEWLGMACVLTVAVIDGDALVIGHVGDTRLYKIHRGQIRKITPDHSPVGEMEDAGAISEIDAMSHPRRNEVYRDVGTEPHDTHDEGFIAILKAPFEPDSAWVICSDGLSDLVTAAHIRETVELNAGDLSSVVRYLIEAANHAGGKDNVTVVYIEGELFARSARRSNQLVKSSAAYEGDTTQFSSEPGGRYFKKHEPGAAPARMNAPVASQPPAAPPIPVAASPPVPQPSFDAQTRPQMAQQSPYVPSGSYALRAEDEEKSLARKLFFSRAAMLIYGFVIAVALVLVMQRVIGLNLFGGETARQTNGLRKLTVGAGMEYRSISEAIEAASAGDVIEVEKGEYQEYIKLDGKDNLTIASRAPGEAVIYALPESGVAVHIANVSSGRVSGFKIIGDAKRPLSVGIRIENSSVEVSDVEIIEASRAGVEIAGPGQPALRGNYIHNYQGVGVRISGESKSELARNVIVHSPQPDIQGRPAIEISQKEPPVLRWNTIHKRDSISVGEGLSKDELLKNNFVVPNGEKGESQPQAPRQPRRP